MESPQGAPLLEVRSVSTEDGRATLVLEGEVDVATVPLLTVALEQLVTAGTLRVELDFERVTFMDSSGLGAIIQAHRLLAQRGGTLELGARSSIVERLFEVSGVERALNS